MSLRGRLLLAIGYVLLVAIVAFEVPLGDQHREPDRLRGPRPGLGPGRPARGRRRRGARRGSEQRSMPLVDTVAAHRARPGDRRRRAGPADRRQRGRVGRHRLLEPARDRAAPSPASASRSSARARTWGWRSSRPRRRCSSRGRGRRRRPDHAEHRGRGTRGARLDRGAGPDRPDRARDRPDRRTAVVAGQLSRPLRAMTRSAERIAAGDLDERVAPGGQQRAGGAGPLLQRDDRAARRGAAEPARVRRRRLPPAAHADHRPAPAARGGAGDARRAAADGRPRRGRTRSTRPPARSTASRTSSTRC